MTVTIETMCYDGMYCGIEITQKVLEVLSDEDLAQLIALCEAEQDRRMVTP